MEKLNLFKKFEHYLNNETNAYNVSIAIGNLIWYIDKKDENNKTITYIFVMEQNGVIECGNNKNNNKLIYYKTVHTLQSFKAAINRWYNYPHFWQ